MKSIADRTSSFVRDLSNLCRTQNLQLNRYWFQLDDAIRRYLKICWLYIFGVMMKEFQSKGKPTNVEELWQVIIVHFQQLHQLLCRNIFNDPPIRFYVCAVMIYI